MLYGDVRYSFPAAGLDDKENKFIAEGRTKKENEAFMMHIKTLANFRKTSSAIKTGKLYAVHS